MADAETKVASYEESKVQLFDLYRRFRYGEAVSLALMNGAAAIEKAVRISLFVAIAISLLTGAGP